MAETKEIYFRLKYFMNLIAMAVIDSKYLSFFIEKGPFCLNIVIFPGIPLTGTIIYGVAFLINYVIIIK